MKRAETSLSSPGGLVVLVGISTDQLSFNTADFVTNHLTGECSPMSSSSSGWERLGAELQTIVKSSLYGTIDDCKASLDLLAKVRFSYAIIDHFPSN